MEDDPVLERIYKARRRISEEHDDDIRKLVAHYQEMERKHPEKLLQVNEMPEQYK